MINTFAWCGVFLALSHVVTAQKWQRGYIWRVLKKLPPFRFFKTCQARHWTMVLILWGISDYTTFHGRDEQNLVFWMPLCILYLDDYLNGDDDDRWKKLKEVGNKIKWKMKLPTPVPAGARGGVG